jgi:hypothetical protein
VTPGGEALAFAAAERLVAAAERRPAADRYWRAYSRMVAAWMDAIRRPGSASAYLAEALELAAPLANAALDGYGQLVAGHVARARGDRPAAVAHFEELARLAEACGSPHLGVMAPWSLAHVAHASGDRQAAIDTYQSALVWLYEVRDWVHLWPVVELLAGWAARNGERELAALIVGHLEGNGIAMAGYQRGRARTGALLAEVPTTDARGRGRGMTRDELVRTVIDELRRP